MKTFSIIISAILLALPQQETKLKGAYTAIFDKKYHLDSYKMTFNEDGFVKTMADAVTYRGKVVYGKYKSTASLNDEENPIEIDNREIGKDTIRFATKSRKDLSLTINRGMMIRIK